MSDKNIVSLTASFKPDSTMVSVKSVTDKGASIVKDVLIEDFLTMISSAVRKGDKVSFSDCRLGGLPEGLVDMSYRSDGNFAVLQQVPSTVFVVEYCNKKYSIPFPSLLFFTKVIDGRVTKVATFAVKEEKATAKSTLYHYPFGNVYGDGRVCWGSNKLPQLKKPVESNIIPTLFFSAPTNSDLWSREYFSKEGVEPVLSKVYEFLNGKEEFPLSSLKAAKVTIDELFN